MVKGRGMIHRVVQNHHAIDFTPDSNGLCIDGLTSPGCLESTRNRHTVTSTRGEGA